MTAPPRDADPTDQVVSRARRVEAAVARAGLYGLPSLAVIIDRVAGLQGKPIRLEQVGDTEWGALTGLWVETPEVSRIFVRRTDPTGYQVVCALHEILHILLGHPSCLPDTADTTLPVPAGLRRARAARNLSASPGQAGFEAEAEYGARLLARSLLRGGEDPTESRFG